jgi:hypothetical protein
MINPYDDHPGLGRVTAAKYDDPPTLYPQSATKTILIHDKPSRKLNMGFAGANDPR